MKKNLFWYFTFIAFFILIDTEIIQAKSSAITPLIRKVVNKKNNEIPINKESIVNTPPTATNIGISGNLVFIETLTGIYTYADNENNPEDGSTFQWYRADDMNGTNKTALPDATAITYKLVAADIGKYISFEVTPSDGSTFGSPSESIFYGKIEPSSETCSEYNSIHPWAYIPESGFISTGIIPYCSGRLNSIQFQTFGDIIKIEDIVLTSASASGEDTLATLSDIYDSNHGDYYWKGLFFRSKGIYVEKGKLYRLKMNVTAGQLIYNMYHYPDGDPSDIWAFPGYVMGYDIKPLPNLRPYFVKGPDQIIFEDTTTQIVEHWATNITDRDGGIQNLTFELTNDNNSLFSVQPAIDATTGTLTYTPAANAVGIATVTVILKDDGGTENGGNDESYPRIFTIAINPVNKAPSFTKGEDIYIYATEDTMTFENWATHIYDGDESTQSLSFILNNDNNSLFDVQPAIDPTSGKLSFTPANNAFGTAHVTVILQDDGDTNNGGLNQSQEQSFLIYIHDENEAPPVPQNFAVNVSHQNTKVNLSWNDVISETSYLIERSVNDNNNFSVLLNLSPDVISNVDNTISNGNTYYYRIKAINENGPSAYSPVKSVSVNRTTPIVTWNNPNNISEGMPLSQNQLNATANVHGTFIYNPALSTILNAGTHTLSVDFTPAEPNIYNSVNGTTVSITVDSVQVPANFAANAVSTNQINLSWNDVAVNTGYVIERSTTSGSGFTVIANRSDNSIFYDDQNVNTNTTYYYRIKAVYNSASSNYSQEVSTSAIPDVPINFAVNLVNDNQVDLSWNDVNTETSYTIQRSVDNNNSFVDIQNPSANSTAYSDGTTVSGNTYYYRIKANNSGGSSIYSPEISVQNSCGIPSNATSSGIGNNAVTINWDAIPGANGYEIVYGILGADLNSVIAGANDNNVTINGLHSGSNYIWRIRTICTENSLFSGFTSFQYFATSGSAACNMPTGTNITGITNNTVTFNWTEPAGATSYEIVYGVLGSGLNDLTASAGTSSINLTGLFSGTTYQVRIRTICTSGQLHSQYSNFIYFTTTGSEACSFPTNLNTTDISSSQATANWDVVAGADSYHIVYGVVGGGLHDHYVAGGASVNSVISGLTASSNYRWRMRTICNTGFLQSSWSHWDYFTTDATTSMLMDTKVNARIKPTRINELKVYPNPSDSYVNIIMKHTEEEKIQLLIYNSIGKLVYTSIHEQSINEKINLKEFGSGLYLIKIKTKDESQIKRVIIK